MSISPIHALVGQKKILLNKSCIISVQSEWNYSLSDQKSISKEIGLWFEEHSYDIYYFEGLWHETTPIGRNFLDSVYAKYAPIEYHIIQTSLGETHKLLPEQYRIF